MDGNVGVRARQLYALCSLLWLVRLRGPARPPQERTNASNHNGNQGTAPLPASSRPPGLVVVVVVVVVAVFVCGCAEMFHAWCLAPCVSWGVKRPHQHPWSVLGLYQLLCAAVVCVPVNASRRHAAGSTMPYHCSHMLTTGAAPTLPRQYSAQPQPSTVHAQRRRRRRINILRLVASHLDVACELLVPSCFNCPERAPRRPLLPTTQPTSEQPT